MGAKKWIGLWIGLTLVPFIPPLAFSYPTLQLDIEGGWYNTTRGLQTEETIVASSYSFDLYALLIPDRSNKLDDTYYISAALVPKTSKPGGNLGYFVFDGQTVSVPSDMYYGVPPFEAALDFDAGDLRPHGIFETYFVEFPFRFGNDQISPYDTKKRAGSGGSIPSSGSGMYYKVFDVDVSGLEPGYLIHFDLYNTELVKRRKGGDIDVSEFAPFSHDAESRRRVPEPSTLLLLGGGLLSLAVFGKRARK
jgi:hypothetical protein